MPTVVEERLQNKEKKIQQRLNWKRSEEKKKKFRFKSENRRHSNQE